MQPKESLPCLDLRALKEATGGTPATLRELLELYVEDVGERLVVLKDSLEQLDLARAILESHTIKGSSATIGALVMEQLAKHIELTLRGSGIPDGGMAAELVQLNEAYREVSAHILQRLYEN